MIHVFLGNDGGMHIILDGEIFGGQAEGIPADGEEHIIALHAPLTGNDIHGGVGAGMAHVQAGAGRIGEFDQTEKFGLGIIIGRGEGVFFFPDLLPLGLDLCRVIGLEFHGIFLLFYGAYERLLREQKTSSLQKRKDEVELTTSRYHSACPETGPLLRVTCANRRKYRNRSRASGHPFPSALAPAARLSSSGIGKAFPFIATDEIIACFGAIVKRENIRAGAMIFKCVSCRFLRAQERFFSVKISSGIKILLPFHKVSCFFTIAGREKQA